MTLRRRTAKRATVTASLVPKKKAIYLRKSRDETGGREDVLSKHRMQLVELCNRNGWDYVLYEEIESSDSLDARPKMLQLLDAVEDGLYDGVVVMEYERLSRGDQSDAAVIMSTFQQADVKIVTPTQTYDLQDETSEALLGVAAIFARMEYRKIKRRLQRGKVSGAKQGKWVQGPTPFPYTTIPDPKNDAKRIVVVDDDKRQHYDMMLSDALAGVSPGDIAIKLNRLGVMTNRNGTWVAETVQKLLLNPFHMGRIIYGKTKTDKDGNRVALDCDEWVTSEGDHERMKTPEEHARLLTLIASRRRIGTRGREGKTPLSGLVKCALCGKTHQSTFHRGRYVLFACTRRSPLGEICPNGGVPADVVYRAIEVAVKNELQRIADAVGEAETRVLSTPALIDAKRMELVSEETKLSKLIDFALEGRISDDMFEQKKQPLEASVRRLKTEIAELELLNARGDMPADERKEKLSTVLTEGFWTTPEWTDKERHTLLSALIDHIDMTANTHRRKYDFNVVFR